MVFSLGWINLYFRDKPRSLKEKRRLVKSLKDRLKERFNVSVAEVDKQDLWHCSTLGIALVCSDREQAQMIDDKILEFFRETRRVEIIDHEFMIEDH